MTPNDEFDDETAEPVVRRRRPTDGSSARPAGPSGDDGPSGGAGQGSRPPRRRPALPARAPRGDSRPPATEPAGSASEEAGREATEPRAKRQPQSASSGRSSPPVAPTESGPDDDEYVVLPSSSSTGRRVLSVISIALLVVAVILGGALLWVSHQIDPSGPPGIAIDVIEIPKGSSTKSIAEILASDGVISNARIFALYANWKNLGPWKAGDYVAFRESSSFDEAAKVLDGGPLPTSSKVVRVTEGLRVDDALAEISDQMKTVTVEELKAALDSGQIVSTYKTPDISSWEGLLFPDTYEFEESASPEVILQTMATKMVKVLDELGYDKAQALQGRSAYELVTIASLIEKETGAPPEERGMISRVISNRLDDSEPLGIDASVLYGLGRPSGELSSSDLAQETPYNTRKVVGLPPTPIALPGRASLEAAISPTPGPWKYYVLTSNDPPSHFFTDSYTEFNKEKAAARKRGVF